MLQTINHTVTHTLVDHTSFIGNEYVCNRLNVLTTVKSLIVQAMGGGRLLLVDDGDRLVDGRKCGVSALHHENLQSAAHEIVLLVEGERIADVKAPIPVFDERLIARVVKKAIAEVALALVRRASRYPTTYSTMTDVVVSCRTVSEHAAYVVIRLSDAQAVSGVEAA